MAGFTRRSARVNTIHDTIFTMKYFFFFYLVVMREIGYCTFSRLTGVYRLSAVNPLTNQSYFEIRNRNSEIHPQTDINIKARICYHIISSKLFWILKEVPIYLDEIYVTLRLKNPQLYNDLYEVNSAASSSQKVYTNRSKPTKVFIGESGEAITENLFTCLSQHAIARKRIFQYFVSDEYDVSDEFSTPRNYVAGRFVYAKDTHGEIRLLAIAEEAAQVLVAPGCDVERHYIEMRKGHQPAESSTEDPLCKLDTYQRCRICSQIFNAYNFEREVFFVPLTENVSEHCEKKQISFYQDDVKTEVDGLIYEEWMIGCLVARQYTGYQTIYWLSRAYRSNQLFVYRYDFHVDGVVIDNLSVNVRLVHDENDSEDANCCCNGL